MTRVRFAPSPTGLIHVGNARVALLNWLFARKHKGEFMFRLDDTDTERSTQAFADQIAEDLKWLGLEWDLFAKQSDRMERYNAVTESLKAQGRLYPCYETPEELSLKRKSQLMAGRPPIYDRAALRLTEAEKARLQNEGRQPHWRFKLQESELDWNDLVRGSVHFKGADLSDPVLIRADGRYLYTLCSVIDDIDFNITHVIRGEDHVTNTAVQIDIIKSLGGAVPTFAHLPLLAGAGGEALSKRLGSMSIQSLREDGVEAMAINNLLARIGTGDPVVAVTSLEPLAEQLDFGHFGRATAKFDPHDLDLVNAKLLHVTDYAQVSPQLAEYGVDPAKGEKLWNVLRANITKLNEVKNWLIILNGSAQFDLAETHNPQLLENARELLPAAPWDEQTWGLWTKSISEKTGLKGKELFLPLRRTLTGSDHGPELKFLLPLMGRDVVMNYLSTDTKKS